MAVTNGWGQWENTIDWGKGKTTATNDWGKIYDTSASGDTNLGTTAAFSNVYSVNMDGVDDSINCGNVTTFNGVTNGSISAWFKSTSGGNLITKYATGNKQFLVQFLSTRIDVYGTSIGFRSTDSVTWLDGNWHHFALSYDASRAANQRFQVYIDKVLLTNLGFNGPTSLASASNDLLIGDRDGVHTHFSGNVDEVALFTTSLDATQVAALYDNLPTDLTGHAGLANWWRMGDNDSGTGTTVTDQAGSNNGTLTNSPTFQEDVPIRYFSTKSILLDGVDDFVNVADNSNLSFGDSSNDSAFSISAWIKPTANNFVIVSKDVGGADEYLFYINSLNQLSLVLCDNTISNRRSRNSGNISSNYNTWIHVVATYNGVGGTNADNGIKLYLNKVQVDSGTNNGGSYTAMHNGSAPLTIGNYDSSLFADGNIDEVAIFNSELSASDVSDIYGTGVPTSLATLNPLSWWRCGDDDTSPTLTDNGSGGNNGTMTNFTAFSTNVPT